MADHFLCAFCRQSQQDPVLLPCCAVSVCSRHVGSECGLCGSQIDPTQVKRNQLLQLMLGQSRERGCERCTEKTVQLHCANCGTFLCKDCSNVIHALGVYQRHAIVPVDRSPVPVSDTCEVHTHMKVTFFCTDDWCSLCSECLETHEDHAVLQLDQMLEDTVKEIATKETTIRDAVTAVTDKSIRLAAKVQDVSHEAERNKAHVQGQLQALKEMISAKEEELTRVLDIKSEAQIRDLLQASEDVNREKQNLEAVLSLLVFTQRQPAIVIVDSLKYISGLLDHLPEASQAIPTVFSLSANVNITKTQEQIRNLQLEDLREVDNGSSSRRVTPFALGSLTSPRDTADLNQRTQPKSSKSPISRSITTLRPDSVGLSPSGKNSSRPSVTPRTPHRQGTFASKSSEEAAGKNNVPSLSSALDDLPLAQRTFVKKAQSSSAIQVSWTHPISPAANLQYILEYGVGTKVGNIEQFRQVYKGPARNCIITDLLPKTSYRFRVAPALRIPDEVGEWSEVVTITTFDLQAIDQHSCGQHATWTSRGTEKWVTFEKGGVVTAINPVFFGKTAWEAKILSAALFSAEDSPSALKIGVIGGKSKIVVGSTVVYSGKAAAKVRIALDADARTMTCYTPTHPQGEQFSHLPDGPLIPALMNKPGKTVAASVKILMSFDLPYEAGV